MYATFSVSTHLFATNKVPVRDVYLFMAVRSLDKLLIMAKVNLNSLTKQN